jgi:hypothetical protein
MSVFLFYLIACLLMGLSALLSGIQWSEADGVGQYLQLLVEKPFIVVVTIAIFIMSGILMQIGKFHFKLSYYEISIIWLATSWVSLATLWLASGIKPSWTELIGIVFCNIGLAISTLGRMSGQS